MHLAVIPPDAKALLGAIRFVMSVKYKITTFTPIQYEIISEIGTTLSQMGANSGLMANVMSWGDTMSDEDTLQNMKDWNKGNYIKSKVTLKE